MNVVLKRKYEENGNRYEEYAAPNREIALSFLRQKEVKDECFYISVVTPEGWFGRDLLEIYNEKTQQRIELPARLPMPQIVKSMTRCASCGYTVLPVAHDKLPDISEPGEFFLIEDEYDFQGNGLGYVCGKCRTLWCACCTDTHGPEATCITCGEKIGPFME